MILLCRVHGVPAAIVGYAPGPEGSPRAIVVMDGRLEAIALADVELRKLPKPLRKQLNRESSKQHLNIDISSVGVN